MKLKINPSLVDHYLRHFKTGFFVAIPFVWDAIQKFQSQGHQLKFDRMTVFGVTSVALVPLVQALYGRYVKQYPHLQPEIQFIANEATTLLEKQLAPKAEVVTPVAPVEPTVAPVDSTIPGQ